MRKTEIIKLVDDGQERIFRITQMPATKAERWANRAAFILIEATKGRKANKDIKIEDVLRTIAAVDYDKVEPLYNELIECCEYLPDMNSAGILCTQQTIDAQIVEPINLYRLRLAAAKLNFSFFTNVLQFQTRNQSIITFSKNTQQ